MLFRHKYENISVACLNFVCTLRAFARVMLLNCTQFRAIDHFDICWFALICPKTRRLHLMIYNLLFFRDFSLFLQ